MQHKKHTSKSFHNNKHNWDSIILVHLFNIMISEGGLGVEGCSGGVWGVSTRRVGVGVGLFLVNPILQMEKDFHIKLTIYQVNHLTWVMGQLTGSTHMGSRKPRKNSILIKCYLFGEASPFLCHVHWVNTQPLNSTILLYYLQYSIYSTSE